MKNGTLQIKTERLYLREITDKDAEEIVKFRSSPEVYQYFTSPHKLTLEEHLRWYRNQYLFNENRIDWIALFNEEPVGVFGLKRANEHALEVEISYLLDPRRRGNGYANEAVFALLEWASSQWCCKIATAVIHQNNRVSIHFAERVGFQLVSREGIFSIYKREI